MKLALVATLVLSAATVVHARPCDDPAAVLTIRQAAEAQCPCAAATRRRAYLACVSRVAHEAAVALRCAAAVMRCARRSVCGNPGHAICCRTAASGATTCAITRSARACVAHPPKRGQAYLSPFASVCDACPPGGCRSTTSTTLGVSAMAEDCRSILVTWSNPNVPVSVSRSTDDATWTTRLRASSIGQATFLDTDLAPATTYHYRVTPRSGP